MNGRTLLLSLAIFGLAGCASPGTWQYRPQSDRVTERPLGARIAVVPFRDARGTANCDGSLLFLVPITPIGIVDHDRVEDGSGFVSHSEYRSAPRDDLGYALADELERSNLFEQVAFVDEVSFADAARRADFDFYFSGTIHSLRYRGGLMTYFLSVFGPVLWVFGVPSAYSINDLDVELVLRSAYDNKVVWRGSNFYSSDARVMGLYYGQDEEFDGYPHLMAHACASWIHELQLAAKRSPRSFHPFPRVGFEEVTEAGRR